VGIGNLGSVIWGVGGVFGKSLLEREGKKGDEPFGGENGLRSWWKKVRSAKRNYPEGGETCGWGSTGERQSC